MTKRKANPLHPWANVAPIDRLLRKLTYEHGCWVWTGFRDLHGYGKMFGADRKPQQMTHRVAYELLVGPIPDGLHLDHLCRNPSCCNPLHLEPVTCRENVLRGASYRGEASACVNGHEYTDKSTLWRSDGQRRWRVCRECANERSRAARAEKRWKRKSRAKKPELARSAA